MGDTATKNKSVLQQSKYFAHWSFPNFTDTRSHQVDVGMVM